MSSFKKTVEFISVIQANKRISIRRLACELQISRRHAYRMIEQASTHLPIRVNQGVIIWGENEDSVMQDGKGNRPGPQPDKERAIVTPPTHTLNPAGPPGAPIPGGPAPYSEQRK